MPTIIRGGGSSLQKEVIIKPSLEEQVILPEKGYRGFKSAIVEPMPKVEVAEPQIEFSSSTGVITASVNQNEGYVLEESISVNYQLDIAEVAEPQLEFESSTGLITASVNQSEGYVLEESVSVNYQLDTQEEQSYTPSTQDYTLVDAGKYTLGPQIVKGDSNLTSDNIKYGKTIFNVQGSYKPKLQTKTVSPNTQQQEVTYDANQGYEGLEKVVVAAVDLLAMYPVGSIYISVNSKSPSEIFGGQWMALQDRFLIGASSEHNKAGGSEEYELVANIGAIDGNILSLGYEATSVSAYQQNHPLSGGYGYAITGPRAGFNFWSHSTVVSEINSNSKKTHIIPPYLPVYMWQRIE